MTTLAQSIQGTLIWGGFRVWQRNRDAFLRSWKVEVGGIAVEPFVVLIAMGFGLGGYIESFGELTYAEFVAPGILASYAMFHATFDSTYGAYLRMETHHIYEAILFTPLEPEDIVLGEVLWGASRSALTGTAVLTVAFLFGLVGSPLALLAIPSAFLIGMTFASISMVLTATATTIGTMNNFFTLVITPMFFFGGVFFPLENLPDGVKMASWALPLTPGVALVRGLVTGDASWWMLAWVLELMAFTTVALWLASKLMRRRLIK
ncbi:MAG: ABC transporter permease [Chloroflexi bacterium]|nr:ABC transporter permease [Chloroflexota bacterium]